MHVSHVLTTLTLLPLTLSAPVETQTPLDPSADLSAGYRIPTRYESTVLGRRLLALSAFGVMSTIFPPNADEATVITSPQPESESESESETSSNVDVGVDFDHSTQKPTIYPLGLTPPPHSVSSLSISLPDYLSDCERPSHGNPTLLLLDPSTPSRNTRALPPSGPHTNVSLSLSWWDHYRTITGRAPWSPASLPRLSMLGYLEEIPLQEAEETGVVKCYLGVHPDARWWLPGDRHAAHGGRWVRMVVREIYWMGGFGDRALIGWLDPEEWKRVGREEWERVRLPGEKM